MRARISWSGSRPLSAPMFSCMWSTRLVAGIAQVTAGCEWITSYMPEGTFEL